MYVESPHVTVTCANQSGNSRISEADVDAVAARLAQHNDLPPGIKKLVPLAECNPVRANEKDALTYFDIRLGLKFTVFISKDGITFTKYRRGTVTDTGDTVPYHDGMPWFMARLEGPDGQEWENYPCCMGVFGITKFDRPGVQSPEWNDRFFAVEGHHDTVPEFKDTAAFAGTLVSRGLVAGELTRIPADEHQAAR